MSEYSELKIDDGFYAEEVRCEYLVPAKKKRIWAVQMGLLSELLRVCRENNIQCFVMWGTLLGAVRHKGFIPWDDDLDVAMSRSEFAKLLQVAPNAFRDPFFFQTVKTDPNYFFSYARLRNSNTTGLITENLDREYNNGIYIDIYPLDGVTDNIFLRNMQMKELSVYTSAILTKMDLLDQSQPRSLKYKLIKALMSPLQLLSLDRLLKLHTKCQCRYNKTAKNIGMLSNPFFVNHHYYFPKEAIEEEVLLPFEMMMVPAPAGYDSVLRSVYKNYMEFPPVEKRGVWHDGLLTYDPDTPYKEYLRIHAEELKSK